MVRKTLLGTTTPDVDEETKRYWPGIKNVLGLCKGSAARYFGS